MPRRIDWQRLYDESVAALRDEFGVTYEPIGVPVQIEATRATLDLWERVAARLDNICPRV